MKAQKSRGDRFKSSWGSFFDELKPLLIIVGVFVLIVGSALILGRSGLLPKQSLAVPQTGKIVITKEPKDALVTLIGSNGQRIDYQKGSPLTIEVEPGSYRLEITAPERIGQIQQVKVVAGETTKLTVKLSLDSAAMAKKKSEEGLAILVACILIPVFFFTAFFGVVYMQEQASYSRHYHETH